MAPRKLNRAGRTGKGRWSHSRANREGGPDRIPGSPASPSGTGPLALCPSMIPAAPADAGHAGTCSFASMLGRAAAAGGCWRLAGRTAEQAHPAGREFAIAPEPRLGAQTVASAGWVHDASQAPGAAPGSNGAHLELRQSTKTKWISSAPKPAADQIKLCTSCCCSLAPSMRAWQVRRPLLPQGCPADLGGGRDLC